MKVALSNFTHLSFREQRQQACQPRIFERWQNVMGFGNPFLRPQAKRPKTACQRGFYSGGGVFHYKAFARRQAQLRSGV